MHIADGFLPIAHAAGWTAAAVPFVAHGARQLTRQLSASPGAALSLGAAGGFTLLLTALKLPSVAGSSSHPTGVTLGTVVCGPAAMAAIGPAVLLLQALFLAHGGLTTLGANTVSMAVVGPWAAWLTWRATSRFTGRKVAVGAAAVASSLATYLMTAFQLALAFPDPVSGVWGALLKFSAIFLAAQAPVALAEAGFTAVAVETLLLRLPAASAVRRA